MIPHNLLLTVEKPARYIGNEINMIRKNPEDIEIRFAFCFPDVYEIGMSHLGLQILYYFLNRRKDTYCERCFAPWLDMEKVLRDNKMPLSTLETGTALNDFDFVGFTLQYELSYTNIINMLELGGIPILAADRTEEHPIICAGGPCAYNPEPLADIIDFFYIGEGEVSYDEILDMYKEHKNNGGTRDMFLRKLLKVKGIYVPKFYEVTYENNKINSFMPTIEDAPKTIKKVMVEDIANVFYPENLLVPLTETVHDRVSLEVFRGCVRGCRFCQAGYIYRPYREKPAERLLELAGKLVETSGHEEISLVSLSTGDYSEFKELTENILDTFKDQRVNISLPSLRIDAFSLELMGRVQEVRKSSLTFAPEAGTQRLRDVINKGITEQEILSGCKLAFEGGWNRVKLYFLMGLPTETDEDLLGIVKLSEDIVKQYYTTKSKRPLSVVVSVSCLVPKPFTPFQWERQNSAEEYAAKQELIKKNFSKKQIKFIYSHPNMSILECVISRGDRRVTRALIKAWEKGARFDGWTEHFSFERWQEAFDECGLSFDIYTSGKALDEILPWDHINIGVGKDFLISEYQRAINEQVTGNCREKCSACGLEELKLCRKDKAQKATPIPIKTVKEQKEKSLQLLRLKFTKLGKMRYIGHLDLQTLFQRAIKRAGLPIEYSQGFNPHQIISFALPLAVGMGSECEFVNILLNEERDLQLVIDSLNTALPEGLRVLEAEILTSNKKAPSVTAATYKITLPSVSTDELKSVTAEILNREEIMVERKTKTKTSTVNIREHIKKIAVSENQLMATLSAGSQNNLKPQLLVEEIYRRLNKEYNQNQPDYIRTELFF